MRSMEEGFGNRLRLSGWCLMLAAVLSLCGGASAQTRVLVVTSDMFDGPGYATANGVITMITNYHPALRGKVDLFNAQTGTPTYADLASYGALLVWTNDHPADPVALGTVCADFVDSGRGVVVAPWETGCSPDWNEYMQGRWLSGAYDPLVTLAQANGPMNIGTIDQPAHEIMCGVTRLSSPSVPYGSGLLQTGASRICSWSTGSPPYVLVGEKTDKLGRIACVNAYPPTTNWAVPNDVAQLFGNAIMYVGKIQHYNVSPGEDYVSAGFKSQAASFTPTSFTYAVKNFYSTSIDWTLTGAPAWVTPSTSTGTLAAGASITVTLTLDAAQAAAKTLGVYISPIVFTDTTVGHGSAAFTRNIVLTVRDALTSVTPSTGSTVYGPQGGPFSLAYGNSYRLTNDSTVSLNWSGTVGLPAWLTLTPSSGTLAGGNYVDVAVSINQAVAAAKSIGVYPGRLSFTNTVSTYIITRDAPLYVRGSITYVNGPLGTGANDGSSWPNAFRGAGAIQRGVNAANAQWGDVWVAAGTYVENVIMKDGVRLYGGFAGGATERNPAANVTKIDGNNANTAVTFNLIRLALVDGFTICNGNNTDGDGGGVLFHGTSGNNSNVLNNCVVRDNKARNSGCGILCDTGAAPVISNCYIVGNLATVGQSADGGGISCTGSSSPTITGCLIAGNTNYYGAGLACRSFSSPTVINCIISGNLAYGTGTDPVGGGVFANDNCSPVFTNCVISGNYANTTWAAGALFCQGTSSPTLTNCTISRNVARVPGGGAYVPGGIYVNDKSKPTLVNCILEGTLNYAAWENETSSDIFLKNCLFSNNGQADVHNSDTLTDGTGGTAVNAFDGCSGNIAGDPNSAFVVGATGTWATVVYDAPTNRTTLTANGTPFTASALVWKLINANTTQTRQAVIVANTANSVTVPNDITIASGTLGYAASGNDFAVMDYQLQTGSPCKDAGTRTGAPATDILGTARPQGAGYDIGAYERVFPITVTFDAQSGAAAVPPSKVVIFGSTYGPLATTSRVGYILAGWWTASTGGTEVLSTTMVSVTADQTLYARWTPVYTVTFDAQGGTAPVPTSTTVTPGSTYGILATTSRVGYAFNGWWTGAGGTGTQVLDTTTVTITADQTLYAKWVPTYIVRFDAQGGTAPVPASKLVTFGSTYGPLATTSRVGYGFDGWWTEAGGAGMQVLSTTTVTITADQTLRAKWTANTYTVTFDAQGGTTLVPPSKLVTFGSAYGPLATTSRVGYDFDGWWTASIGGLRVLSATTVTNPSNHTLYALWTETVPMPVAGSVALGALFGLITIAGAKKMRRK